MASIIKAISHERARIEISKAASTKTVAEFISPRTNITEGMLKMFLCELSEALYFFARQGRPIKLDGVGVFTPTLKNNGTIKLRFRTDKAIQVKLNEGKNGFVGKIINKKNLGKTADDLAATWNKKHPGDPVKAAQNPFSKSVKSAKSAVKKK